MKKEPISQDEDLLLPDEKFERQIQKGINRHIYSRIFKVLCAAAATVVVLTWGLSRLLNVTNYQPTTENDFIESPQKDTDGFDVLTTTYFNMYYSGTICQGISDFQALGFGNYQVEFIFSDAFDAIHLGVGKKLTLHISRSTIKKKEDEDAISVSQLYEYLDPNSSDELQSQVLEYGNPQDEYEDILCLPDSALLDVAVSFWQPKNSQELIQFAKQYPDSWFHWVALDTDELMIVGQSTGFSLYDLWRSSFSINDSYPSFYLDNQSDADALTEHYLSQLKLLTDHPQFTKMMDNFFLQKKVDYEKKYQDVLQNGIMAIGMRGRVTKQDLLKMIESQQISHLTIYQAKLSKYA